MATVEFTIYLAGWRSKDHEAMPVPYLPSARTEILTVAGTSVATTIAAAASGYGRIVEIHSDADIWVTCGPSPVAVRPTVGGAAGSGIRVKAGVPRELAINPGDKIAAITV